MVRRAPVVHPDAHHGAQLSKGGKKHTVPAGTVSESGALNEFYVVPASVMSSRIKAAHQNWLKTPGKDGRPHKDSSVRTVHIPPHKNQYSWDVSPYRNAWHLIEEKLADEEA